MIRQLEAECPAVYLVLSEDDSRRNAFIHEMSKVWDLSVVHLPPVIRDVVGKGKHVEVINFYRVGSFYMHLGMQGEKLEDSNGFICAVQQATEKLENASDALNDVDIIFHGHKDCDKDTLYGLAPLREHYATSPDGKTMICYPLKDWTDEEIWAVSALLNIPQNKRRYDLQSGEQLKSKVFNSDYYPLCTNCLQPGPSPKVYCPAMKKFVPSNGNRLQAEFANRLEAYRGQMANLG